MNETYNIFISWSGKRSGHIAAYLREWLPTLLQSTSPWMSGIDIEKGSRGLDEIRTALAGIKVGISCLTPENLTSPWIHYEAGCLTKTVDDKTRLCTYLLGGLTPSQIPPPLGMFQHTKAEREDTKKLIHSINKLINEHPLSDSKLDNLFDKLWPDLEKVFHSMPAAELSPPKRNEEDMISEILDLSRAAANSRQQTSWIDQYAPTLQRLFPLLDQAVATAQFGFFTLVYHDRPQFSAGTVQQQFEKFFTLRAAIQRACNLMESPTFHDPFILAGEELVREKMQLHHEYEHRKTEIHDACRKNNIDLSRAENAFIVANFTPQGPLLKCFADQDRANAYLHDLSKAGNGDVYVVNARAG